VHEYLSVLNTLKSNNDFKKLRCNYLYIETKLIATDLGSVRTIHYVDNVFVLVSPWLAGQMKASLSCVER